MPKLSPTEESLFRNIDESSEKVGAVVRPRHARPAIKKPRSVSDATDAASKSHLLPIQAPIKIELPKDETSMEELYSADEKAFTIPQEGDVIKAIVIDRSANEVRLSVSGYGTGVVRGRELFDELDEYSKLKNGDEIEASVVELENEQGDIELSFRRAGRERVWKTILEKLASGEIQHLKVLDANKGGLIVMLSGMQGFVPVSQLTIEHYPRVEDGDKNQILDRLKSYIGEAFDLKVLDADPAEEKLILSEKAAQLELKKDDLDKLSIGEIVEGSVTGIVDFGAFVQFDDMEGLVHISEMAWQRIDDPHDIIKVGAKVQAQIIGIDGARISLSMKKLQRDPWLDAVKTYSVGMKVKGVITKVTPFGAFVQLDDDIHGLVHISELSIKQIKDPAEVVAIGDRKEFRILSIEPSDHRLGLSLKAVEAEAAGIEVELPKQHEKVSIEQMEQLAEKKSKKEAVRPEKSDVVVPDILAEKSEHAEQDEKKHKARQKERTATKAAKKAVKKAAKKTEKKDES